MNCNSGKKIVGFIETATVSGVMSKKISSIFLRVFPLIKSCAVRWSVEFFLIGQKRSTNERSGMILEVQIQYFGSRRSKFSFQKIPGGLNINILCENWYEASFYNKEQAQKYEF